MRTQPEDEKKRIFKEGNSLFEYGQNFCEMKNTACLKPILSLFIRWMLNDVALFDRIYIRALIFLQLQLLRESFPDNNRGRCVTNSFQQKKNRVDEEGKCNTKKNPNCFLLSFSLSLALLSFFWGC